MTKTPIGLTGLVSTGVIIKNGTTAVFADR